MNKISLPEIILLLLIVVPIDVLEVFVDLGAVIPVLGIILVVFFHIIDWVSLFITQFYFILRTGSFINRKILVNLVGNSIEFFPGIDILPWRTTALVLTIYLINKKSSQ